MKVATVFESSSPFHDAQAERDNLGGEQKVDDVGVVHFDQRADHADDVSRRYSKGRVFETVLRKG